jgi:ATP-dependent DNA ligase
VGLTPATRDPGEAGCWLAGGIGGIEGVVAKRLDGVYASGERAMEKVKLLRTADCVVGGIRWAAGKAAPARNREIGSLLLGVYGEGGLLHYVGHAASFDGATRHALTTLFLPLVNGAGFSGEAPGATNRWARDRSTDWVPVRPEKVVEVRYHHASGGRFRHGTQFIRTRPDKDPRDCTFDQLRPAGKPSSAAASTESPAR